MSVIQGGYDLAIKFITGLLLIGAVGCTSSDPHSKPRSDSTSGSGIGSDSSSRAAIGDSTPTPTDSVKQPSNPNPLLARMQLELQKVKPDIVSTELVSLVQAPAYGDTMTYAVVARGTGPHRGWQRIEDVGEIFGVFWVDRTLTRPAAPIDVFPSRRLRDYDVWLQRAWGNAVVVCAEGRSYGDGPMRREIEIEPDSGQTRKVTVDTSDVRLGSMGDSPCGSSGPKGD